MTEYRTVPVEPTFEMLEAMVKSREGNAVYKNVSASGIIFMEKQAKDDYNAAIATAPASELADTIAAAVKEAGELLGAPAALLRDPCTWREDDEGTWFTDCDNAWAFVDAGPEENNMAFCPFCGGPLVTMRYQCDEEDEDG
jgi:hypothetical protein